MKKYLVLCLILTLLCGCLTGCKTGDEKKDHLVIVTTIFPFYDWVRNVVGENPGNIEVKLLLESGVDLHSYQPTAEDVMTIGESDLFLYVGGESDKWVKDALRSTGKKDITAVALMDVLGDALKEEEVVEGMQGEEEDEEEEDEIEYDEHIWLSLRNAKALTNEITERICTLDSEHETTYRENGKAYADKLQALDEEYVKAVSEAGGKTLLFGDRFPFRYMTEDYGLTYYAAFLGCSAESEASFETIAFLAQKVEELSLPAVIVLDGSNHKIAETVIQNTNGTKPEMIVMNSLQSVSKKDIQDGTDYFSVMKDNLEALKKALK